MMMMMIDDDDDDDDDDELSLNHINRAIMKHHRHHDRKHMSECSFLTITESAGP